MAPIGFEHNGSSIKIDVSTPQKAKKALTQGQATKEDVINLIKSGIDMYPELEQEFSVKKGKNTKNSAEKQREDREKALRICGMHGAETARACYVAASEEDKAKLRKIVKYEAKSMILTSPEGQELFRSHGMLDPIGLFGKDSLKNGVYDNGHNSNQTNIEAQWIHWFDAPQGAGKGNYDIKRSVLEAAGMKDSVSGGSIGEWNSIYDLFVGVENNSGGEEIAGMQIARQMMGITGWIWTNEKTSSVYARRYGMLPENCSRYNYIIANNNLSVVGLENLQLAK